MTRLVSSIYGQAVQPKTPEEKRRARREAYQDYWHRFGVAIIDPADVINDWDRQHVENIATKLYGERGGND